MKCARRKKSRCFEEASVDLADEKCSSQTLKKIIFAENKWSAQKPRNRFL